ncbi:MAG: 16S rRNA (uracil(1498)-N(3))-methyltransferase [Treponema sp.]|nr:16S rRNA (uracil(1498)-N(3))-methyltransferase [Treponema sp.]
MNICLFSHDEIDKPLSLHDERAQHLIKVLHKKKGDAFVAGVIDGKAGEAIITDIVEKSSEAKYKSGELFFSFTPKTDGKKLFPLVLVIGFPRPIQLKRLLRDVSGLGVCAIYLTGTELGEKSYMNSTLVERGAAYKMLLDGTAQAGGTYIPELHMHKTLAACLHAVAKDGALNRAMSPQQKMIKIALDNVNAPHSLTSFLDKNVTPTLKSSDAALPHAFLHTVVVAAIGSERGWTAAERHMLESAGYVRCSMGERIFRTETAATVASALILAAMGAMEMT